MKRQVFSGRNVSDGECIDVEVVDGVIQSIKLSTRPTDLWLASGLIDLQVNGYGGYDLNAEGLTIDTVKSLALAMSSIGTTTFLPTLITASEQRICAALRTIAEARRNDLYTRHCIPFVHLEGPHISAEDGFRGAHPAEHIRPPDLAEFHRWQNACDGLVGMVTLSPHFAISSDYIRALVSQGVRVAIGHTSATHAQIEDAVEAGATLSTHLGNGIAQVLPRHPNALWTQLAADRLNATFIADGHHLPAEALKVMVRTKSPANSILVSDTVALAGMPSGEYTTPVGGRVTLSADGRLSLAGSLLLAGAALPLRDTVLKAMQMCELSLSDAFRMVTANPGRFIGGRGVLRVGAHADLVQFAMQPESISLEIQAVVVQGQTQERSSS